MCGDFERDSWCAGLICDGFERKFRDGLELSASQARRGTFSGNPFYTRHHSEKIVFAVKYLCRLCLSLRFVVPMRMIFYHVFEVDFQSLF